jgi:methylphosphotriester-DNA--protein-cysteine methyltransferase
MEVVECLQKAANCAATMNRPAIESGLQELSSSLPIADGIAEHAVLNGLLLEFTLRCGRAIHTRCHAGYRFYACSFVPERTLAAFLQDGRSDPCLRLRDWIAEFFKTLNQAHPASIASRAADLLYREYSDRWTLESLAERVDTTPTKLRRAFDQEYSMSVREYARRLRVINALEQLRTTKIESIAMDVGYHSKKNFYCALKQLTGLKPTAVRSLSSDDTLALISGLKDSLGVDGNGFPL